VYGHALLGIDIGSEWLRVALYNSEAKYPLEMVINEQSNRKSPALVGFTSSHERVFGEESMSLILRNPSRVYSFDLKRILGHKFESEAVSSFKNSHPYYNIVKDDVRGTASILDSQLALSFSVEQIIAMLLRFAKETTLNFAQMDVSDCVISVPPWFTADQREMIKQSAQLANLKPLALLNDVTAVAIDYAALNLGNSDESRKVIFFSVGQRGSTASLVEFKVKNKAIDINVLDTQYEENLGGYQLDDAFVEYLVKEFDRKLPVGDSVKNSRKSMTKLRREAKIVKEDCLSSSSLCDINLEELYQGVDFNTKVTREQFESITANLYEPITTPIDRVLKNVKPEEISAIELFGGAIRYYKFADLLQSKYPNIQLGRHINSDESNVLGAAYYGAVLTNQAANIEIPLIRRVTISHEVAAPISSDIVKPLGSEQFRAYSEMLQDLDEKERERKESIMRKNQLESYIIDSKDYLDTLSSLSESVRTQIMDILTTETFWLEDQNGHIPAQVYDTHLNEAKDKVDKLLHASGERSSVKMEL